jgi:uncharacterized membrane protein SpoIIM required for sporulation
VQPSVDRDLHRLKYEITAPLERIGSGTPTLSDAFTVIERYERLASTVYLARGRTDQPHRGESFLADIAHALLMLQPPSNAGSSRVSEWYVRYRKVWRENLPLFLFCVCLFVATAVVGWVIGRYRQEFVPVLVPQSLLEHILDHRAWFDAIAENPLMSGIQIAVNNIRVSLLCFLGAGILGLGGLYILGINGLMLGAILGFCASNAFHDALLEFVVGHGPLELTIIVASAFSSFLFGRVFYMRPYSLFRKRFKAAFHEALTVASGVIPWLLVAAVIEAFVSPMHAIPVTIRLGIGVLAAMLFWIWTFWPLPIPRTPTTGATRTTARSR